MNIKNPKYQIYIDEGLLHLNNELDETIISFLKQSSGKSNLESINSEISKLEVIKILNLDSSVIPDDISPNILKFYKRKIISDTPEQVRKRPEYIRYPLVIIFCYLKKQEITDNLIDHLCNLIHKIKKKAQKVENKLNNQIGRLSHGLNSLYKIAEVAYDKPEDIIKNAIYPVVPRDQLINLFKVNHIQNNMRSDIHKTVMRSYSCYYRKQIFEIINVIEFKSNNQLILDALVEELKYIKRKFINQDDLHEAITKVVNAIFRVRDKEVWGEATTACASDSRKFTSWDQNLISEWHSRYKGPGVMIYWHVSKQSICVYSQLKTCSSSEVASMLQGIISQGSDMLIESQYVDSHGKSELGFAISYLLGFKLLPRYSDIGSQKIYVPNNNYECKNIKDIIARAINWSLIKEHYNCLIKYVTALKIGTLNAESIIRQFSKTNFQNPIFKAFIELGKAVETIFLCKYLSSIELRQDIHSGLNIVENWNSLNDFIFYGKKSEITSNNHDEQEYSMLCLHLLQVCLAYVNTLLIQEVLTKHNYALMLTFEDKRGITPLIYSHINPYGVFELDMNKRILL